MALQLVQPEAGAPHGTRFAPAARLGGEALAAELSLAAASPIVEALLRSLGCAVFVVNAQRQILAANTVSLQMLGLEEPGAILGLRPGEAVGCVHGHEEPGGCGTARACATCGAVLAMLGAMKHGRAEARECALTIHAGAERIDLDLAVLAVPFDLGGHPLVMVALTDVGEHHRRAALERAFYHDVNNVLTGLVAAAEALDAPAPRDAAEAAADVRLLADRLVREVQVQRVLTSTRFDDYQPACTAVETARLFEDLARLFHRHPAAAGRTLAVAPPERPRVVTDQFLLTRVLTNMLKNAFEATPAGGEVRLAARDAGGAVRFEVHNPGAIPAAVAPRIFQRHFSTKSGPGRGEGTWSMKSLGERLLGGTVGFETDRRSGTTFWLRLPDPRG
jgi:nitrogen fixation/metabolism regulation signal transduction histidine kinase